MEGYELYRISNKSHMSGKIVRARTYSDTSNIAHVIPLDGSGACNIFSSDLEELNTWWKH